MPVFSVSQLTAYLRALLDGDEILRSVLVQGEVSNLKYHSSGHVYFTLKDKSSCLRAVMFRSRAAGLLFRLADGMQVIAQGNVTVYDRDGQYQIYVNSLQPAGIGSLHLAYEQLKQRLQAEGLFDSSRKRPLPAFPRVIGLATSPTGAAIRDILSIIQRRYPKVQVWFVPIVVQGSAAPPSIVRALELFSAQPEVDVVIVGRGGGSLEELWAFNDEAVARAIAACSRPVISAVGHETDFTIADLVADRRAATPSAAAELVVPLLQEVERNLELLTRRLAAATQNLLADRRRQLTAFSQRRVLRSPEDLLRSWQQTVDGYEQRLQQALVVGLREQRGNWQALAARLDALSPLSVLARGYSITLNRGGQVLSSPDQLQPGEQLETILASGRVISQVIETRGSADAASAAGEGDVAEL